MSKKRYSDKTSRKYKGLFNIIAISLVVGFIAGISTNYDSVKSLIGQSHETANNYPSHDAFLVNSGEVKLCFTPPKGCAAVISNIISTAQKSIYVQAYGMSSTEIVNALIQAHARGVKVRMLLDKSNISAKYSRMPDLQDAGIDVAIDKVSGIAHNKIMIIDEQIVITGSFNFTKSADTRNVENVVIINNVAIAGQYLQNWLFRKSKNSK